MSIDFEISKGLKKTLEKLASKNRGLAVAVHNKIAQITRSDITTIQHFKNLKGDMSHLKRVHVGSFVLMFKL